MKGLVEYERAMARMDKGRIRAWMCRRLIADRRVAVARARMKERKSRKPCDVGFCREQSQGANDDAERQCKP